MNPEKSTMSILAQNSSCIPDGSIDSFPLKSREKSVHGVCKPVFSSYNLLVQKHNDPTGKLYMPITPMLAPWPGKTTARERFNRQMHFQTPDRCFNVEFVCRGEYFTHQFYLDLKKQMFCHLN